MEVDPGSFQDLEREVKKLRRENMVLQSELAKLKDPPQEVLILCPFHEKPCLYAEGVMKCADDGCWDKYIAAQ